MLLHTAETLSHDALKDIRQSVSTLRETSSQEEPFLQRLRQLLKPFENTGYHTEMHVDGQERFLTPEVEILFIRTLQEGLSNIGKHSSANNIQVYLTYHKNSTISMKLIDDGIGAKAMKGGYGILGIKERVEQLNGKLEIDSSKNKGFSMTITLPGIK
jgi:signal transduction histidine kinase